MKKIIIITLSAFIIFGALYGFFTSEPTVPKSEYDLLVNEKNALQSELSKLNNNTVSIEEYNRIAEELDYLKNKVYDYDTLIEERDRLKIKVAEYEKKLEEIEDSTQEETNTDSRGIDYPNCPLYFSDCGFTHYNITIDSFEAAVEQVFGGQQIRIKYTISGVTDNSQGSAFLKVFCYDADGYSVDTGMIRFNSVTAGEQFKLKDEIVVDASTSKIVFEKP